MIELYPFKFQSDSINTGNDQLKWSAFLTLNSNLILLILMTAVIRALHILSLNSNLILLIRNSGMRMTSYIWTFKFQSDSINTLLFKGV